MIIPCLNEADTIATQLEALANQVWFQPWEVIVSDNGSTDNSIKIVERYRERICNLQIIDASDRQGQAYALNMGVEASSGEFLAFCDADDEVGPGWVAAIGNALSKHDFIACRTDIEKLNSAWVKKSRGSFQHDGIQKYDYPSYFPHAGGGTIGVKRWIHEAIGGFDESLVFLHDTDYCWKIQLMGIKLHFVSDALIHIRLRNKLKDIYMQAKNYGEYNVLLYKNYQKFGMPRLTWKKRIIRLAGVIKSLLKIRDIGNFAKFVWNLGWYIGWLKGNIIYRIFIL